MNCENCGNNKTTKTTTALLGLVVVAALAGTMISIPTMVGSANAQACDPGFTKVRNECVPIVEKEPTCPTPRGADQATLSQDEQECVATGPASSFKEGACRNAGDPSGGSVDAGQRTCTFAPTLECPEGTTETSGGQCVGESEKPGKGPK